ncbi:MAG: hypothetical protein ABII80_03225 [bacterium]
MARLSVFLTTLCLLLTTAPLVLAETMQSDSYRLRFGNFNMTSGTKTSLSYNLTDTVGQTVAGLFTSAGYSIKAGFQYLYTLYDFSFSLSGLAIDFGSLTPSFFQTASHTITVSAPGQGYSVSTIASSRLQKSGSSDFIPNTSCNAGTCTTTTAGIWDNTSAYGFGYNLTGNDIASDFVSSSYYRPFADFSLGGTPAVIMSTSSAGKNRSATVTYQINTPTSQPAGYYSTQITYIATPTY